MYNKCLCLVFIISVYYYMCDNCLCDLMCAWWVNDKCVYNQTVCDKCAHDQCVYDSCVWLMRVWLLCALYVYDSHVFDTSVCV